MKLPSKTRFPALGCLLVLASTLGAATPVFAPGQMDIWKAPKGVTVVTSSGPGFDRAFHLGLKTKPASARLQAKIPTAIGPGALFVHGYFRRLALANGTDAEGMVEVKVTDPRDVNIHRFFLEAIAREQWAEFRFPVEVAQPYRPGELTVQVELGHYAQEVEVGGLSVEYYPPAEAPPLLAAETRRKVADAAARPRIGELPDMGHGRKWKPIFTDEFDGPAIDESKWLIVEGTRNEVMRSRRALTFDGKGHVVFNFFKEGSTYYQGWLDTTNKFMHTYGFYSIRMTMKKSIGHNMAFWLQSYTSANIDGSGRDGTEIDVIEKPWLEEYVNHALHWDGYGADHQWHHFRSFEPGINDGWHTLSVLWTPEVYVFYVDGYEAYRTTAGGVSQAPARLLISNSPRKVAKGKSGGYQEAILPDSFMVDWVRAYELTDVGGKPVWPVPDKVVDAKGRVLDIIPGVAAPEPGVDP